MIDDLWYKNAVFYSLDVETFMDANGDGVGDFEGLVRRLDYLHSLGVDAIWLAPFQSTPNRDNGYDVTDFYGVDARHGTSGDFVEFMHHATHRGIRVIIDLVANHTSDQHPWFQQARRDPSSRYRDWYVWSKRRPKGWDDGMVFPGVQRATWTHDREAGAYYFHRFYKFQPDLNMENPEVRAEIRRIMGYWLELGVSGFRVDAVPFMIETPVPGRKKASMRFECLDEMSRFLKWRRGDGMMLGEANVEPAEVERYFGEGGNGLQMMFNFHVNQRLFHALAVGDPASLARALEDTRHVPATAQWAQFLRNHDELDLGRLTDEERERVFRRFGPEPEMQLYDRGIRRRLAPMLGDRARMELAYSALFSLPGAPVLRYGDELGMGDLLELPERDAIRTPMQWSEAAQGGFSLNPRTVHPVISDGPYSFREVNVENQRRDPESLLNRVASLIRLRKECPEIGWGDWRILPCRAPTVLAIRYTWRNATLVVLHNFGDAPAEAAFKVGVEHDEVLDDLQFRLSSRAGGDGTHQIALPALGYRWLRVRGMDYLLHRGRD